MLRFFSNEAKAKESIRQLVELLHSGGFHLTKFASNRSVLQNVPLADRREETTVWQALGLPWDVGSDSFFFQLSVKKKEFTRRGVLSMTSQIFDPLGFFQPFLLPAKILLQKLSTSGIGWDDRISDEDRAAFEHWLAGFPALNSIRISRCLIPPNFKECTFQLHCFTDASFSGYGAVVFLRVQCKDDIHCSFVMGRSRVSPTKPVTIPRLELTAAVVGVELMQLVRRELDLVVRDVYFWTDSTSVLHYVRSTAKRYQVFVANRIATIQAGSDPLQWHHVPTSCNPADLASRGTLSSQVDADDMWIFFGQMFFSGLRFPTS